MPYNPYNNLHARKSERKAQGLEDTKNLYEPRDIPAEFLDGFVQTPGETATCFALYKAYRDLGPGRTINEAARVAGNSSEYGRRSFHAFHWRERVQAYDRFLVEAEQNALITQARAKAVEVADRRAKLIEREWEQSERLFEKASAMLKWPLARQEISKDGKTIAYIPAKWSQFTVTQLLELASQLGRRSLELPTSYQQIDASIGIQSTELTTAHMTPDEKERHDAAQALAAQIYLAVMQGQDPKALIVEGSAIEKQPEPEPPDWYTPNRGPAPQLLEGVKEEVGEG